jgi:predicted ester cyclase
MGIALAKELALRLWQEGWSQGRLEVVDEAVAPEGVDRNHDGNGDFRGHLKGVISEFRVGFPDLQATVEDIVGEGDRLAMRVSLTGTHDGPFFGEPASGRKVRIEQYHFVHVNEHGQALRHWADTRIDELFRQLRP